jgi:type IV pilus assembly protein PilB
MGGDHCHGRGAHGRIAVAELMRVTLEIRRAIARQLSHALRTIAWKRGMIVMRAAALTPVDAGTIAIEGRSTLLAARRMAHRAS